MRKTLRAALREQWPFLPVMAVILCGMAVL